MLEGPWSQGSLSTDVSYFVPCSSSKGLGHKEELLMPNSVLLHLHSFSLSRLNKVFWDCHSCTLYPSFNDFTDGWRGAWQEMDKCHRRGKGRAEHMQGSTATQGQQHPSCHLRPGLQGWDGWRKNEIRVGKNTLVDIKQSDISKDSKLIINNQERPFHFSENWNTMHRWPEYLQFWKISKSKILIIFLP